MSPEKHQIMNEIPREAYNGPVRSLVPVSIAVVGLALSAGCGRETVQPASASFQVKLVTSGRGEVPRREMLDEISVRLEDSFNAEVSEIETDAGKREALETAAREGTDLVVCFGEGFQHLVIPVGRKFPETIFVLDRGVRIAPNVGQMEFLLDGAAYLGGVTAALVGGTRVGILDGGDGGEFDMLRRRFRQGFRSRHPWVEVARGPTLEELPRSRVVFVPTLSDPTLFERAQRSGIRVVTIGRKPLENHGGVVVASIVVDLPEAVERIAADVVDDTFIGRVYAFDLGSGVVGLELDDALKGDPVLIDALDEARAAVNAGMVEIEGMGL